MRQRKVRERTGERGGEDESRGERREVMKIMCIKKHKNPYHREKVPFSLQKRKNTTFSKKKSLMVKRSFPFFVFFAIFCRKNLFRV